MRLSAVESSTPPLSPSLRLSRISCHHFPTTFGGLTSLSTANSSTLTADSCIQTSLWLTKSASLPVSFVIVPGLAVDLLLPAPWLKEVQAVYDSTKGSVSVLTSSGRAAWPLRSRTDPVRNPAPTASITGTTRSLCPRSPPKVDLDQRIASLLDRGIITLPPGIRPPPTASTTKP